MVDPSEYKKGILFTVGCYIIWGLFPLYWYPLGALDPLQTLAQRICWSALFAALLVIFLREGRSVYKAFCQKRTLTILALSAFMLSMNWLIYLWAIAHHHVLDASLGYFITPIFSIFLGRVFFKESLNLMQYVALALAAGAILWLTWLAGTVPYVAIGLATSFGLYGLLRKLAPLGAIPGLAVETFLMTPLAALYLIFEGTQGRLLFASLPTVSMLILLCSGVVTSIPLLMFAAGAKRIPLSLLGIIQYISPTIQFALGIVVFNEVFEWHRFMGFMLVWAAVILYLLSGWYSKTHPRHV
ncbi:MAG: EamA family transporter RarD [Neisseriaceae bacterium]|nr:EamA family transporter RarD [Neisseriaceae bacterium]